MACPALVSSNPTWSVRMAGSGREMLVILVISWVCRSMGDGLVTNRYVWNHIFEVMCGVFVVGDNTLFFGNSLCSLVTGNCPAYYEEEDLLELVY